MRLSSLSPLKNKETRTKNLGEKERRQKLQKVEKRRRIRQGKTMSFAENMQSAERSTVKNLYNCVHREVKDAITMSF